MKDLNGFNVDEFDGMFAGPDDNVIDGLEVEHPD